MSETEKKLPKEFVAMALLTEIEPHLDALNFPITLHERVTKFLSDSFGPQVRPSFKRSDSEYLSDSE